MSKNTRVQYQNLYLNTLCNDPRLTKLSETNPQKLNTLFHEAMQSSSFEQAMLLAQKLTLYAGVPGIIHYINASIKHLEKLASQGEMIQQMGFNTLVYLKLAQKLYQLDPEAKDAVSHFMPEEENIISEL